MLDISKIESNLIELKNETFKVSSLVDDIVSTCRPMVTTGQNRLVVQCPAELGSAMTDQTKLRQAALNLMSNAAKFTKGGTIVLSAARERRASGDWIEIRVTDTGIGLSKEEIARLFENFAQASVETSRKYGGTGLGLAISQKFCALMGGGIAVTSEVGQGSVFSICVPANACGSPSRPSRDGPACRGARTRLGSLRPAMPISSPFQSPKPTPEAASGDPGFNGEATSPLIRSNPRLLVVDDVADNRAVLARRFQRRNFEIVEAEGGIEALELIDSAAPTTRCCSTS